MIINNKTCYCLVNVFQGRNNGYIFEATRIYVPMEDSLFVEENGFTI